MDTTVNMCEWPEGCTNIKAPAASTGRPPRFCEEVVDGVGHTARNRYARFGRVDRPLPAPSGDDATAIDALPVEMVRVQLLLDAALEQLDVTAGVFGAAAAVEEHARAIHAIEAAAEARVAAANAEAASERARSDQVLAEARDRHRRELDTVHANIDVAQRRADTETARADQLAVQSAALAEQLAATRRTLDETAGARDLAVDEAAAARAEVGELTGRVAALGEQLDAGLNAAEMRESRLGVELADVQHRLEQALIVSSEADTARLVADAQAATARRDLAAALQAATVNEEIRSQLVGERDSARIELAATTGRLDEITKALSATRGDLRSVRAQLDETSLHRRDSGS